MGQLACVRLSKPMLESCWETVGWYVDFHVDALLLSAGKRPDMLQDTLPVVFWSIQSAQAPRCPSHSLPESASGFCLVMVFPGPVVRRSVPSWREIPVFGGVLDQQG